MEAVKTISKKALYRDQIRDQIRQAIINRDLLPGDRIVETRWARDLGVSQAPVREAIRELELLGYVVNVPYKGAVVRRITKTDLLQNYRIRSELEKIGAEEACERITEEEKETLRAALDHMKEAAAEGNFEEYVKSNADFHQQIINASHNHLLIRLWEQCSIESWIYHGTENSEKNLPELAMRHEDLYEAIVSGNTERALNAAMVHTEELSEEIGSRDTFY